MDTNINQQQSENGKSLVHSYFDISSAIVKNPKHFIKFPVVLLGIILLTSLLAFSLLYFSQNKDKTQPETQDILPQTQPTEKQVLGSLSINIPVEFATDASFAKGIRIEGDISFGDNATLANGNLDLGTGTITASNIIYSLTAGDNVTISGDGQNLEISAQASDISLSAGSGLSVDGLTISNTDTGSSQNIFKNFVINDSTLAAGSNTDTLKFLAGTGITLSTDAQNKAITISGTEGSQYSAANGLTQSGDDFILGGELNQKTSIDQAGNDIVFTGEGNIGIGTATPSSKMHLIGNQYIEGSSTISDNLTVNGSATLAPTNEGTTTLTLRSSGSTGDILDITNKEGNTSFLSIDANGALTVGGSTLTNAGILESGGAIKLTNATDAIVGTAIANGWTLNDNTFTYRRVITVTNASDSDPLPTNHEVTVTLSGTNANEICSHMRSDGNDLRMGFNLTEIARNVTLNCSTSVTVTFQLQSPISPSSSSTEYAIYYGNENQESAGPTYIGNIQIDTFETINTNWTSSDSIQLPITQETTTVYAGTGSAKATATVDNYGTFSSTNQSEMMIGLSDFGFLSHTLSGTTYAYILGGSTNGTASGAQTAIYRAEINSTNGNVGTWATNSESLLGAVSGNAVVSVTPVIDAGTEEDGSLDLSLGDSEGGCRGTGLSWSGSTCTIKTKQSVNTGPVTGPETFNSSHTIQIPSGVNSGKFLTILDTGSALYDPATDAYTDGPSLSAIASQGSHSFEIPSGAHEGKILTVLGGKATTNKYDPATNTFSAGPDLTTSNGIGSHSFEIPSGTHEGKILTILAGSKTITNMYDPATNTYSLGPSLSANAGQGSHSFTIPSGTHAGKILTVLGNGTTTTNMYDPDTHTFSAGPSLTVSASSGSHSIAITSGTHSGKIMTIQGNQSVTNIYDPGTHTFGVGASLPLSASSGSHSFQIPSGTHAGKILTIRGTFPYTYVYDPATNTYSDGPDLTQTSSAGSHSFEISSGIHAGKILTNNGSQNTTGTSMYDPATHTYSPGPSLDSTTTYNSHSFEIPSGTHAGKILTIVSGSSNITRLYNPATNTYTAGPTLTGTASLGSHSFLIPSGTHAGKILTVLGDGSATTNIYNPATNTYSVGPNLTASVSTGAHSIAIPSGTHAGKFLTVLGNGTTTNVYDPATNTYTAGPTLTGSATQGSHSFQIPSGTHAGKILTIRGNGTTTNIYDPATHTYSAGPSLTATARTGSHSIEIPSGTHAGKILTIIANNSATTNIYDPATNTYATGPNLPATANEGSFSFELDSGYNRGKIITATTTNTSSIYDPATNTYSVAVNTFGTNTGGHSVPITSGIHSGKMLVVKGGGTSDTNIFDQGKYQFNFSSVSIPTGTTLTSDGPYSDNAGPYTIQINATENVTINGTINLDNKGYGGGTTGASGYGPGAATGATNGGGCGGSHGALGGLGGNNSCTIGSVYTQEDSGSGGSGSSSTSGGAGGGGIVITSGENITIDGTISANGQNTSNTTGNRGGAGSGGLIKLTGLSVINNGTISANGGTGGNSTNGNAGGGGGAGGRVIISYVNTNTPGTITSDGGAGGTGATNGSAGGDSTPEISSASPTIYSIGGTEDSGSPISTINQATINASDATIGEFSNSANNLPQSLSDLTAHSHTIGTTNYIYTIGGTNGSTDQTSVLKFVLSGSTLGEPTTTGQAQLPVGLSQHASALGEINGTTYIWIIGGKNGSTARNTIYKATLDENGDVITLSDSGQATLPTHLYGHTAVFTTVGSNNYLYITGGTNTEGEKQTTVYKAVLDIHGTVTDVESVGQTQLATPISGHASVTMTDENDTHHAYIVGGIQSTIPVSEVLETTINSDQTGYILSRTDFTPMDLSNKNDIAFMVNSSRTGSYMTMDINVGTSDSPDWQTCNFAGSGNFTVNDAVTWEQKICDISGISNRDAVTGIRFRVTTSTTYDWTIYFDTLQAFTNAQEIDNSTTALASVLGSSNLTLNAQGTGIVAINYDPTNSMAGSGGFTVFDGGSTPLFSIDGDGNASMSGKLTITGNTHDSLVTLNQLGDGNLFSASASGVTKFVIGNNGNVGIGTSDTSLSPLAIAGLGTSAGTALVADANGNIFLSSSSQRYKENIQSLTVDFKKLLDLDAKSYNYMHTGAHDIGFLAEDLDEKGLTELVIYDKNGRPDAIKYDRMTVYLTEIAKKQNKDLEEMKDTILKEESKIASLSAEFSELKGLTSLTFLSLDTEQETAVTKVDTDLVVMGMMSARELSLVDSLTIGNTLQIGMSSINSLDEQLEIQSLRQAALSFMADAVRIETDGSVYIAEDTFFAKNVSVEGSLTIDSLSVGSASADIVLSDTEIIASSSAGSAKIAAGQTEMKIYTDLVKENSLIYITPEGKTGNQTLYIAEKKKDEYFIVQIENSLTHHIIFNYLIIDRD